MWAASRPRRFKLGNNAPAVTVEQDDGQASEVWNLSKNEESVSVQ
jgi:hypothetical protein